MLENNQGTILECYLTKMSEGLILDRKKTQTTKKMKESKTRSKVQM